MCVHRDLLHLICSVAPVTMTMHGIFAFAGRQSSSSVPVFGIISKYFPEIHNISFLLFHSSSIRLGGL